MQKALQTLAVVMLATGCGDSKTSDTGGGNPVTAPVDYLDAISKGQQSAVKTIDLASINQALQMFQVEHGRNPKDLNELVTGKYMAKIPEPPHGSKIVYDAAAGQVRIVKQ
jgi:hypothetical protein